MRLVVLGATGSIGESAFDVIGELDPSIDVAGISCESRWRELAVLAERWNPEVVAIVDEGAWAEAREAGAFGSSTTVLAGEASLVELASWSAECVLNAVVGAAGLPATVAALEHGSDVALANKESLVVGGDLVIQAAASSGSKILPVDSEHNAIWQLLEGRSRDEIRRIVLTASGGPFRELQADRLSGVTPQEALDHPTWSMGPKITIDSATLANKGLEIIEAHHLFELPYERIEVVVHPQSIVHGLVELVDGTVLAELGPPDMRPPIRAALTYPDRVEHGHPIDIAALSGLTFEAPDTDRFPALAIARAAGETGGTAPAVFNAVNEVSVSAFLDGRLGFMDIPGTCERVLADHEPQSVTSVELLLEVDRWARDRADDLIGETKPTTAPAR